MEKTSILVDNGIVVTMDRDRRIIRDGAVFIQGNKIEYVGKSNDVRMRCGKADHVIDAKGKAVLPGLVNTHDHPDQSIMRNLAYDMPYQLWDLKYVFNISENATSEDYYTIALLTYAEMLRTGTTCVACGAEAGGFAESIKAVEKSGIRAVVSSTVKDEEGLKTFERAYVDWNGKADGRINIWVGPLGWGKPSAKVFEECVELAKYYKTGISVHVSGTWEMATKPLWSTKKREIEYLRDLGVLGPKTLAAHCTWATADEIQILMETDTKVSHNPVSNMYLSFGTAPIPEMLRAGVTVALGTDGLGSNTKDLFEVMRIAAYLHKNHTMDPLSMTAQKAIEMATINGYKALGLEKTLGSLEEGKIADLIVVNLKRLYTTPLWDVIPALVYCAKGTDVETAIVNGEITLENGKLTRVNEAELIEKTQRRVEDFWKRAKWI